MSDILVWGDIENFGLDERRDPIIEIGFQITDLDLNTLAKKSWLCWGYDHMIRFGALKRDAEGGDEDSQFILNMHTENDLFDVAQTEGWDLTLVESEAVQWLQDHGVVSHREPLCGSSVSFDRRMMNFQMPTLNEYLHYRIIDCSTLKELCRRYNKRVYENIPPKEEHHRVDPDLTETIEEFKFYRDEFLSW
jgi:oligoribonuclease